MLDNTISQLQRDLAAWDGKTIEDIEQTLARYASNDDFTDAIVVLLSNTACHQGASWLLKRRFEQGVRLDIENTQQLINALSGLDNWQAKLHCLQSIGYLQIPSESVRALEYWDRHCLTDSNKFVRAWAYSAFFELADQYPKFRPEVLQFFELAARDEPASVLARIRQLKKRGFR